MNSRWKVAAQIDGDMVRLVITEHDRMLGVLTMSTRSYRAAAKDLIIAMTNVAQRTISDTLARRLWADAQSQTLGLDAEAAKDKLEDFGWSQEKINQYANELAVIISQHLIEMLPGRL